MEMNACYVGIGKKPHKVLTFPVPDIQTYKPKLEEKSVDVDFLGDEWIYEVVVLP